MGTTANFGIISQSNGIFYGNVKWPLPASVTNGYPAGQTAAGQVFYNFHRHGMPDQFVVANDPLPGFAVPNPGDPNSGGSIWAPLGWLFAEEKKIGQPGYEAWRKPWPDRIIMAPLGHQASGSHAWRSDTGAYYPRLSMFRQALASIGDTVTAWLVMNGETDASASPAMPYGQHTDNFRSMLQGMCDAGDNAPVFFSVCTTCRYGAGANLDSLSRTNRVQRFRQQASLIREQVRMVDVLSCEGFNAHEGPIIDLIDTERRYDKCHIDWLGQVYEAEMWEEWLLQAKLNGIIA